MTARGGRGRLGRDGRLAAVILLASLALLAHLLATPSEGVSQHVAPLTLPTLLVAAIAVLAVIMLAGSLRAAAPEDPGEPMFGARTVLLIVATGAYLLLLPWIGYVPATAAYSVALAWLFGERRPLSILALAALPALALYFFFEKFMIIPLPAGRLLG